jgi:hypothetical protein
VRRYPPNWHLADRPLTPLLMEPQELVSLGTGALISGDERCPERPQAAVAALGPTDAFLSVLDFVSPSNANPRPKRLFAYLGAVGQTCTHHRPSGVLYRTQIFEDRGRVFQVYVAIGDSAGDETRRELAEILNSLTVDP